MASISATLTEYHRCCEALFKDLEGAIGQADWDKVLESYGLFRKSMDQHFAMEESVLFPAFERRTGKPEGPTRVLRFEHGQIRDLMDQLGTAVRIRDAARATAVAGRLYVATHEHTSKEEKMMYPEVDALLSGEAARLIEQMRCLGEAE